MAKKTDMSYELQNIERFFTSLTGKKLRSPVVIISPELQDAEECMDGVIKINPTYMAECNSKKEIKITEVALVAHGYFHHAQQSVFKPYGPGKLWTKLKEYNLVRDEVAELVGNLTESTAMFFAVAYLTRDLIGKAREVKMKRYLKSVNYLPPSGKHFDYGNDIPVLFYLKGGSVAKTVKSALSYDGQARMVRLYLEMQSLDKPHRI